MARSLVAGLMVFIFVASSLATARGRWTTNEAKAWYAHAGWVVGSNYLPATAVNDIEMWQTDTFDQATIDRELMLAENVGMNTMRVFLHHLVWEEDPGGLKARMAEFLEVADRRHIKAIFVLFDSDFDANPQLGPQAAPPPGVYFPGWVQGPGRDRLEDKSKYPRLKDYVSDVIGTFASDSRVLMWDVWNEPTPHPGRLFQNGKLTDFERRLEASESKQKAALVETLLPQVFTWARRANPSQPLTSAIFDPTHAWASDHLTPVERTQIEQSDVTSFHSYSEPTTFESQVTRLRAFGRPIICTEYMARPISTVAGILPIGKRLDIGMLNWGLVSGRSQARFPVDSWEKPYVDREPKVWTQDLFHPDGTPYDVSETNLIRTLSAAHHGRAADYGSGD